MDMLGDVVICEPVRTAVGRFGGQFRGVSAEELGAAVVRGLIERSGLPPDRVEDVIFAQCYPTMDAPALGRVVALDAGLPVGTCGMQLDRRCGSGLQAVISAVMQVATGGSSLVIAGGAESMSNAPFYSTAHRWGATGTGLTFDDALHRGRVLAGGRHHPVAGGMLETAETLRAEHAIPREAQDALAARSHMRAIAAQKGGLFDEEIVPVTVPGRTSAIVVTADEHPRADATEEKLARLTPIRIAEDPEATVTAGNASGQNDGAAACIVTTRALAESLGLRAFARLRSWAVAGVPPRTMGIGPVPAVARALGHVGLGLRDIDLIELNEAFAVQVLACARAWALGEEDFERINVNGSGISLGHPLGATGGRILATLLREMDRRDARFGLETMCIGGGQGIAALFERA
ncbi:acetyl-CoA C-acetyltransferase [Histidinibacterium lentulum]|uniref:Acetyl-CoA C-acyltransferase n=1 Tax=Histidinibacterium lentulum TaxID=2480588 RepID=A0A3N2QRK8_9RHOB|nr:acetyl-CoA C-acetyltransferase [Histidinibacterium lentulum]ROT97821.1 acetyl-CoA C-acyltransferase [Histidinibacterium lentulum]